MKNVRGLASAPCYSVVFRLLPLMRALRFTGAFGGCLIVAACSGASSSLTSPSKPPSESFGMGPGSFGTSVQAMPATMGESGFATCLQGAGNAPCFSGTRVSVHGVSGGPLVAAPLNLAASASGGSVTLTWVAPPAGDAITGYIIEAGSASGLANLANFATGNTATSFSATGVGAGTYFVRVRATGSSGVGAASNEAVLVVGAGPCTIPGAPSGLGVVSSAVGTVVLQWSAAAGAPTSYIVEAGSAPGLTNLANSDLGSPATGLTATGVGPGVYYVRVRAKNACGVSVPSNEVTLSVGSSAPTPAPTPPGGPRTAFGSGQYLVGSDIAAGRYYSVPAYGCYWERQSGLGGALSDIIANEFVGFNAGQWIVDILSSDRAFKTDQDCGTWSSSPRQGLQASISPGVWLVGAQVSPGTYRANAQYGCYWERRRNFTGNLSAIISNNFVSSAGPQLVSIGAGDAGFLGDGDCGVWTRVGALTADVSPAQSPENIELQRTMKRSRSQALAALVR